MKAEWKALRELAEDALPADRDWDYGGEVGATDLFITACRPATILRLLDELEAAKGSPDLSIDREGLTMCWPECGCGGEQAAVRCVANDACSRCEERERAAIRGTTQPEPTE